MLVVFLFLPLISICILLSIPQTNFLKLKQVSLFFSFLIFYYSLWLWIKFSPLIFKFQFFNSFNWISYFNMSITLGIDNLSLFFILLTTFLFILCFLYNWNNIFFNLREYLIFLFLIEFFLILIFISLDLFLFYFFFESILIPMFFLISFWGSKSKKIRAAYFFFFYTLVGSITFLAAVFYILNTYNYISYPFLYLITFSKNEQILLWLAFFITFASKVPMIPFHIWLPEAHVEAPTTGSILLAGILLKLGVYGFLRFLIPLFPFANFYFLPLVSSLSIIGIIYPAFTAIRQIDLKRIIAYSSISHMNLVILGVFSFSFSGIHGAILQSLSHGFVASGLFFSIGFLYDRYHTRLLNYYSGLAQVMPLFSLFFLIFILANIAIPGTSNFTGEFLILISAFKINKISVIFGSISMILGGIYSLNLLNHVIYGNLKTKYIYFYYDLTLREFTILSLLIFFVILLGIYPNIVLNVL